MEGTAGAAQSQPSGNALPSLLSLLLTAPQDRLLATLTLNPTRILLSKATPANAKTTTTSCLNNTEKVIGCRTSALEFAKQVDKDLTPLRERCSECLPQKSPAGGIHFPLIKFLAYKFGFEDKALVKDLSFGMPIVGDVKLVGTLTERLKHASMTLVAMEGRDSRTKSHYCTTAFTRTGP